MYEYRCTIVKVVDGDTVDIDIDLGFGVWLKDQRVRLAGIDAPESRTSDDVEKLFGNLSKKYVENYLPVGSKQTLLSKDYHGKYGRILGDFTVYDGNLDRYTTLTEMMLKENMAVPYDDKEIMQENHLKNREALRDFGPIDI